MKIFKKLLAVALIVMLMAAMFVPASAASTKTITITNAAANHSFEAYQIFTGDLSGAVLSNIQWGTGVNSSALLNNLKTHSRYGSEFAACTSAEEVAAVLEDDDWTAADTDEFARLVGACLNDGGKYASNGAAAPYTITVPAGYYFVKDVTPGLGNNDAYTKYIIYVTTDVPVSVKSDVPTMAKQVSLSATTGFTEAVSASVGDYVYFKLTANLKARVNDYSEYHIEFVDTLPKGLTYDSVESVSVSGLAPLTAEQQTKYGFSAVAGGTAGDGTQVVTLTMDKAKTAVKELTGAAVTASDTVVVVFKAKVNSDILVNATTGNTNTAILKYSNNPNDTANYATKLGQTSPASAKVYSYGIEVLKIDSSNASKKLPNAKFKLYRLDGSTPQYAKATGGVVTGWTTTEAEGTEFVTDSNGVLTIKGLGKNTYYLKETLAPTGYNTIKEPIEISFVASFNLGTGEVTGFTASVSGHGFADLIDAHPDAGLAHIQVKNTYGATLPETGGIGTTIFYVVGLALIVGAAVLLVSRKRKNAED